MNRIRLLLVALAALFAAFFLSATIYTEWLWFQSLGYERLFFTGWLYRAGVGSAFGFFTFLFLAINVFLARRLAPNTRFIAHNLQLERFIRGIRPYVDKYLTLVGYGVSAVVGLLAGISMGASWEAWLRYLSAVRTGTNDPIFGLDISFYFFTLPILESVLNFLSFLTLVAFLTAAFIHLMRGSLNLSRGLSAVYPRAAAHLAVLAGLFTAAFAFRWWLAPYNLLYSPRGAVYGAGYTDVRVLLPAYRVLFFIGLAAAVLIVIGGARRRWQAPAAGLATLGLVAVVGTVILPVLVQEYRVTPNELAKEKPYIARGLKFTRRAFGIDNVVRRPFSISDKPDPGILDANRDTIDNLRLWDWRPLQKTYNQIQAIRLYYNFNDVDLDRYVVDGRYRQIALSAREMDVGRLQATAQTWVNKHLVYTHGYGVVASPVNEVAGEGLPDLIIKNIPPKSSTDLKITRPEIYFGESTNDYAIVNTKTNEFDYPAGDRNKYATYEGSGGVSLNSYLTKLAFSYRFGTVKPVLSDALTAKSRVLFHRNIKDRLETLTPFIAYDSDPYMVVVKGRLYWLVDGYTVSNRYPYSKPVAGGVNYMRNSIKAVVNAYDGSVDFYISDRDDPIIKSYARAYPGTFKQLEEMDDELRAHIRYPETFFRTQAEVFRAFHMEDPQVFYNKEDLWDIPQELYESTPQPVDPYYLIMRLPGEKRPEFALILPFTPTNKSNMIAWLAARSDGPDYGRLVLYNFPKDKLIFGPLQIEARLDQNPEISRELSLWSQRGSRVIRGNLLVVPVGNRVLYVEPIYLQAESGELPELKRVAVGLGDKVVMEPTLERALAALMGVSPTAGDAEADGDGDAEPAPEEDEDDDDAAERVARAARALEAAEAAQQEGDWTEYGRQLDILKSALEED